jgi:hydroxymethylpyrimidine/phosphomethylpyrimidine kinase
MSGQKPRTALTIAGFDPSGGAGVLADARTFGAFGLEAAAAITSITFQTPEKVIGAIHQTAETLCAQLGPLLESANIVSSKTGMLPTKEIVLAVSRLFREADLPAPVIVSGNYLVVGTLADGTRRADRIRRNSVATRSCHYPQYFRS